MSSSNQIQEKVCTNYTNKEWEQLILKKMPTFNHQPFESRSIDARAVDVRLVENSNDKKSRGSKKPAKYTHYQRDKSRLAACITSATQTLFFDWHQGRYILTRFGAKKCSEHDLYISLSKNDDMRIGIKLAVIDFTYCLEKTVTKHNKKVEKEVFDVSSIGFLGITVANLIRLFVFSCNGDYKNNGRFEFHELQFIEKVLKVANHDDYGSGLTSCEHDILDQFEPNTQIINKLIGKPKGSNTIENFANKIVVFSATDIYMQLYGCIYNLKGDDYNSIIGGIINNNISLPKIQELMNLYFLNTRRKSYANSEDTTHDFYKPRTLLSILEEYHNGSRIHNKIKQFAKKNKDTNDTSGTQTKTKGKTLSKTLFSHRTVAHFCENDAKTTPLSKWALVRFSRWVDDYDMWQIQEAFDDRIRLLRATNDGYSYDPYDYNPKIKKSNKFCKEIREGIDMYEKEYEDDDVFKYDQRYLSDYPLDHNPEPWSSCSDQESNFDQECNSNSDENHEQTDQQNDEQDQGDREQIDPEIVIPDNSQDNKEKGSMCICS